MSPTLSLTPYHAPAALPADHVCECGGTCGHCGPPDPNVASAGSAVMRPSYHIPSHILRSGGPVFAAGEPLSPNVKTGLYVAAGLAIAVGGVMAYKRYAKPAAKASRKSR